MPTADPSAASATSTSLWMLNLLSALLVRLCLPTFVVILVLVLFLASFGKSLGIRRLYVRTLLKIFEFVRNVTVAHNKKRRQEATFRIYDQTSDEDSDDEVVGGVSGGGVSDATEKAKAAKANEGETLTNGDGDVSGADASAADAGDSSDEDISHKKESLKTYGHKTRHNVISRRDNLILSPDRPPAKADDVDVDEAAQNNQDESSANTNGDAEASAAVDSAADNADAGGAVKTKRLDWPKRVLAGKKVSAATLQRDFELDDIFDYVKTGIASVIEDEVTQRFIAEELKTWNLLTRTSQSFEFVNVKLTVIWIIGFLFRYCVLLPGRTVILVIGMAYLLLMTSLIGWLPESRFRRGMYEYASCVCFRILSRSFSAVIQFHNVHFRPRSDGICVANHTTPIDVVILNCDRSYALVGQSHGGINGLVQRALSRATSHIWFERAEVKDRLIVAQRLKEHVDDPAKLPILIFPEGTCINNTSVMQFKKGSFEIGGTIYPVAIKYDAKFGDAFWNSSENGMLAYVYKMMTSWAIVCDVWYLPPMHRRDNEDAVTFANRVKAEIARQGGLVDLMWDGNLKRNTVKSEWKALQQQEFSKRLKVE